MEDQPPSLLQPQRSAPYPALAAALGPQPSQPQRSASIWQPNLSQTRNILIFFYFFYKLAFLQYGFLIGSPPREQDTFAFELVFDGELISSETCQCGTFSTCLHKGDAYIGPTYNGPTSSDMGGRATYRHSSDRPFNRPTDILNPIENDHGMRPIKCCNGTIRSLVSVKSFQLQ